MTYKNMKNNKIDGIKCVIGIKEQLKNIHYKV